MLLSKNMTKDLFVSHLDFVRNLAMQLHIYIRKKVTPMDSAMQEVV